MNFQDDMFKGLDDLVADFHRKFDYPINEAPINYERLRIRGSWKLEEVLEYQKALTNHDLVAALDALGDLIYFAIGTCVVIGCRSDPIVREIHRSNMTKLGNDGEPIIRGDGKILKGPNFIPPDIVAAIVEI